MAHTVFRLLGLGCWLLATTGLAAAQAGPTAMSLMDARSAQLYSHLEAQAATQTGARQAETLSKLAAMDSDAAHAGYHAGNLEAAGASLTLARERADQALALLQAEAARGKTDGMKNVEMTLQSITFGLREMVMSVPVTVRPMVQQSQTHFDDLRAHLLALMFAPKGKPPVPAPGDGHL